MSSPQSSLKKGSRSPNLPGHISGHRPIPFRHPAYSEDESRLLEEVTTSMAASRLKARDPFSGGLPRMESSPNPSLVLSNNNGNSDRIDSSDIDDDLPPSDHKLLEMMMTRLTFMEQKVQQQEHEIMKKDRRIKVLEDKLSILSKARGQSSSSEDKEEKPINSQEHLQELEQHCLQLQRQVHDMETFLADYGMIWVGEPADSDSDVYPNDKDIQRNEEGSPDLDGEEQKLGQPFKIDFDLLFENIRDLNVIAGEGEAQVQHTASGARLTQQQHVPVTFYANGMLMFDGPFRPYSDPTTKQCMLDFLDGYFPSELQSRHPEGVPFIAKDMREVFFKPNKGSDLFSGAGNTLGGNTQSSRLIAGSNTPGETDTTPPSTHFTSVTSEPPFKPITVETLLNSLPKSVVKDGKVMDIRDSVAQTLTGESAEDKPQVTVVDTEVTRKIKKAVTGTKTERPKTPRDIATLRIKSEDGGNTYIVKLKYKETIGDLRRYLDAHRTGHTTEYDIYSTYPRRIFSDDKASMESCGLKPNGVLHLEAKKKT